MGDKVDQSGMVPFRIRKGEVQVLLVTTSSGKHWTIPKGHIEKGMSASKSAAKEAFEEAGVEGDIIKPSIGAYTYEKNGCRYRVKVFLMAVGQTLSKWPEKKLRQRKWFPLAKAAKKVHRKGVKKLLKSLTKDPSDLYTGSGE